MAKVGPGSSEVEVGVGSVCSTPERRSTATSRRIPWRMAPGAGSADGGGSVTINAASVESEKRGEMSCLAAMVRDVACRPKPMLVGEL